MDVACIYIPCKFMFATFLFYSVLSMGASVSEHIRANVNGNYGGGYTRTYVIVI